ncbi:MAG: glycosyltransferase [Saprospiraceae bacterium]|nr:glycosyltransferase [Saprospiraceae bacterium]
MDTDFYTPSDTGKKYELGFVGNMGYRPNVLASQYLAKEVIPQIIRENGKIKMLLAGARPDYRVRVLADDNITVSGWMEDIRDAYNSIRIFVSPIFTGMRAAEQNPGSDVDGNTGNNHQFCQQCNRCHRRKGHTDSRQQRGIYIQYLKTAARSYSRRPDRQSRQGIHNRKIQLGQSEA